MKHKSRKTSILIHIIIAAALLICLASVMSFAETSGTVYHDTEEEAAAELREHMKQREESVTIGLKGSVDQNGLQEMIGKLAEEAMAHTGKSDEGDYIGYQYASYKGFARTTYVNFSPAMEIEYTLSYYDNAQQESEVNKKIGEIIDSLKLDDKSDFEKINAIHDYICSNVEYAADEKDSNSVRTAYSALIEGRAVCQGYSVSLYRLLLEAGIDNRIIFGQGLSESGESGAHTWNIIELNDEYYYMDVTWDDVGGNYQYFLIPAEAGFEDNHIADDSYDDDFFTADYPMSHEAYTEEAVGLRGKILKLISEIKSIFSRKK